MAHKHEKKRDGSDSLIDANLRKVYDEIAAEELPDRFKDLLQELQRQDQDNGTGEQE